MSLEDKALKTVKDYNELKPGEITIEPNGKMQLSIDTLCGLMSGFAKAHLHNKLQIIAENARLEKKSDYAQEYEIIDSQACSQFDHGQGFDIETKFRISKESILNTELD